ncbi:hypothetical protein CDAR_304151 [Caerostris darwini]|uniref:Uncharacterized protein n=1 Tax=Caerostris darwini TaxID=1538125 RepID=A0AAV4WCE2_9ARAC|nr:hypothetical protein CDAR_304151 [Caerostris darwini]
MLRDLFAFAKESGENKSLANGRYLSQLRSYGFCIAAYEFKATALVTPAATFLPGKRQRHSRIMLRLKP